MRPIQRTHFGHPVTLEGVSPWTGRRVPLWSREIPFSLCSASGPVSRAAPVFVRGREPGAAEWVARVLRGMGFEGVEVEGEDAGESEGVTP